MPILIIIDDYDDDFETTVNLLQSNLCKMHSKRYLKIL